MWLTRSACGGQGRAPGMSGCMTARTAFVLLGRSERTIRVEYLPGKQCCHVIGLQSSHMWTAIISFYLCPSLSLSRSLCFSLALPLSRSLSLTLHFKIFLYRIPPPPSHSLSISISISISLSLSLSPPLSRALSLSFFTPLPFGKAATAEMTRQKTVAMDSIQ